MRCLLEVPQLFSWKNHWKIYESEYLLYTSEWFEKCSIKGLQCSDLEHEQSKMNPYHTGYFYLLHFSQLLSNWFAGFQILVCIYKQSEKQCVSWSAGFIEISWSGSTLFSKCDIFGSGMVGVKWWENPYRVGGKFLWMHIEGILKKGSEGLLAIYEDVNKKW